MVLCDRIKVASSGGRNSEGTLTIDILFPTLLPHFKSVPLKVFAEGRNLTAVW